MLFLLVSMWGADDSVLIQRLFLWNSDRLNETLESFISGGGSYFHFKMADLLCFLIIGVKYLEIESINPMKIWSFQKLQDLCSRLVPTIILGNFFFSGKTRVRKWVVFPIFSDFLSSQCQVPLYISTPSNNGDKCHHGF